MEFKGRLTIDVTDTKSHLVNAVPPPPGGNRWLLIIDGNPGLATAFLENRKLNNNQSIIVRGTATQLLGKPAINVTDAFAAPLADILTDDVQPQAAVAGVTNLDISTSSKSNKKKVAKAKSGTNKVTKKRRKGDDK